MLLLLNMEMVLDVRNELLPCILPLLTEVSDVQILESRFARNTAQAVLFENVAGDASYNVTVDGCLFEENMDAFGYSTKLNMDVIHYEIPTVQILNSKFSRNRAVGKSAVYVTGDLSDAGPSLADHDATNKESAILRVRSQGVRVRLHPFRHSLSCCLYSQLCR